ncbi:MAG: efflux RND transporter periplasmic adaptor subunit [Xanthomonadales bacterium]|nr:efflux RND transporter periplasmic adaptor subunit [Xanthomonadales bacterium]
MSESRTGRGRQALMALVVLGLLLSLVWWARQRADHSVAVDVATVEQGVLADTVLASGALVYAEQIQLRSELTGRVAEVLVSEGQRVQRGDLLMRLEPEAFEADLSATQARVRAAQLEIRSRQAARADLDRQLDRQRQLRERGLVGLDGFEQLQSQQQIAALAVESAREQLRQAEAERDRAADRLQRTRFIAPIDGLLVAVDVKPGETVIAGTVNIVGSDLMVLADPAELLAELRVDEADIGQVRLEQGVEVFAAAYPTSPLRGRVTQIATSARPLGAAQSLAFEVRVSLQPGELRLFPGMSCRAEIEIAQGEAGLHVPIAAVRRDEAGSHVLRLDATDHTERVAIEAGLANDVAQSVRGELAPGDRVVVGPGRVLEGLKPGTPVRIRETP